MPRAAARSSRSQVDDLIAFAQDAGAKGLSWIKHTENGLESSIVKFFPEAAQALLIGEMDSEPGDLLLFVADKPSVVARVLGALRLEMAKRLGLIEGRIRSHYGSQNFPARIR